MKTIGINVTPSTVAIALVQDNQLVDVSLQKFPKCEQTDGSSLALPRRLNRGSRRRLTREKNRKKKTLESLASYNITSDKGAASILTDSALNPWDLRKEILDRKATSEELMVVIHHLAIRRGFKSSRKDNSTSNDDEAKKLLHGVATLIEKFKASGYRTIGEYLYHQLKRKNHPGEYSHTVSRSLILEEIDVIFEKQKELGNSLSNELKEEIKKHIRWQKPIQSYYHLLGECTLEVGEKRAAKRAYTSECFVTLSLLANLRIIDRKQEELPLDISTKLDLFALAHKQQIITFNTLRNFIKLDSHYRFNLCDYYVTKKLKKKMGDKEILWNHIVKDVETTTFIALTGFHTMRKAIENPESWKALKADSVLMDEVATILSFDSENDQIEKKFKNLGLSKEMISALINITDFNKTNNLSLKAMKKIIPLLKEGKTYNEALDEKYNKKNTNRVQYDKLPVFKSINNPVVNRALANTRKMLNAFIKKYGMPDVINVEVGRELPKSSKQRKMMNRDNKKNRDNRKEIRKNSEEFFGRRPTAIEMEKYGLWLTQNKESYYSSRTILDRHLKDPTETEIDYIIPYHKCFDNSINNKVLCLTNENRNKNDKTVHEMYSNGDYWENIEKKSSNENGEKKKRLLIQNFDERKERLWQDRHLNDTRYVAKVLIDHLKDSLDVHINVFRPGIINYLRNIWSLNGIARKEKNYIIDAAVISVCTWDFMKKISIYNKYDADKKIALGLKPPMPKVPWRNYREDVINATENAFIVKTPIMKTTGQAHGESIYQIRGEFDGIYNIGKKVPIEKLTTKNIEHMVDKTGGSKVIYQILKQRLQDAGGVAKKAFHSDMPVVYKGINIRSVRLIETRKKTSGLAVSGGFTYNKNNLVRLDVYLKDGKHLIAPVYTYHFALRKLPEYCINSTTPINESYKFICSIYKNEWVQLGFKNSIKEGYFSTSSTTICKLYLENFDVEKSDCSITSALWVKKYSIDLFGNKHLVKKNTIRYPKK